MKPEPVKSGRLSLKWRVLFVILFLSVLSLAIWHFESSPVKPSASIEPIPEYTESKRVSYSITVKNSSASLIKGAELWVYAPVSLLSSQRCCEQIETSHPYEMVTDSLGNQVLKFNFEVIPPYAHQLVHISTSVNLATKPNHSFNENSQNFLAQTSKIESADIKIKNLAARLKVADDLDTARNIYQWIYKNINKRDYTRDVRGALYAMNNRQGDCTENAYLFVALTRAAAIPARAMGGYMMNRSGVLHADDYHNWAEFYIDGRWIIADPYQGIFNDEYENYIATRIIGNQHEGEFTAHRYWYKGKGLTVAMN